MQADYKNRSGKSPTTRKKAKPRRPAGASTQGSSANKGWLGMLVGISIGLFVAFLVYINQNAPPLPAAPKVVEVPKAKLSPKPVVVKQAEPKPAEFGFYQRLEHQQVDVNVAKIREERVAKQRKQPSNLALQVGSFRSVSDADSMKAQMAFLGFEANIVRTESDKHGVWHRVRLGPYSDKRVLQKDRAKLYSNNIKSLMITLKK